MRRYVAAGAVVLLGAALMLFTMGCGGGGDPVGGSNSNKWDEMRWDEGVWG